MEIRVARAVLQLFREEQPGHLPAFSTREWENTYYWLDTSGMALYLLDRLHTFGLTGRLPEDVLRRLERNRTDNRARTQHLFDEFTRVNASLIELGIRYANLKGFTLISTAVADPCLRYQSDHDLLIPHREASRVSETLKQFGYLLTNVSGSTWEFKADSGTLPAYEDLYKPAPQRSIEIHLLPAQVQGSEDLLDRMQIQQWSAAAFPSLGETDKFISLAQHLFRHMRSEWTRLSWVLEFKRFCDMRRDDEQLWQSVRTAASSVSDAPTAIGASLLMANLMLGDCTPPGMQEWTIDCLPLPVRIWIERYSEAILLTEFPGTKLYLLLETALTENASAAKAMRRRRLFPLRPAPFVVHGPAANDTLRLRAGRVRQQLRHILFRLRFHLVQGLRYLLEAQRWKRVATPVIASASSPARSPGWRAF